MIRKYDDAQRELRSVVESLPREKRELHEVKRNERKLADELNYYKARLSKYEPPRDKNPAAGSEGASSSSSSSGQDKVRIPSCALLSNS